jgi:hypothetical protein
MRSLVGLLFACAVAAGCGSSQLGGPGGTGAGGSPGTVTFHLTVAGGAAFCDQESCGGAPQHLSIMTSTGVALPTPTTGNCGTTSCTSCQSFLCPEVAIVCPAPEGVAYTGEDQTWDGSYGATSTCGASHLTCQETKFVLPGRYVAQFCATPGAVTPGDGGPASCDATASAQCTETTFDFPSPSAVTLTLPAAHVTTAAIN